MSNLARRLAAIEQRVRSDEHLPKLSPEKIRQTAEKLAALKAAIAADSSLTGFEHQFVEMYLATEANL